MASLTRHSMYVVATKPGIGVRPLPEESDAALAEAAVGALVMLLYDRHGAQNRSEDRSLKRMRWMDLLSGNPSMEPSAI